MKDVSSAKKDLLKLAETLRQEADRLTREAKSLEAAAAALAPKEKTQTE